MNTITRSVIPPLLSLAIVMLGNSFFTSYISLSISLEGSPDWLVGVLQSAYYAGILFGSLMMERLIAKIGHIRSFALFSSFNAAIITLQALTSGVGKFILFRFFTGTCAASYFIIVESWLLLISSAHNRGKALSLYMLSLYLASGSGQFILNFTAMDSYAPFGIAAILCSLAVIPLCLNPMQSPTLHQSEVIPLQTILKQAPIGFFGAIISGMMIGTFYGLGPVFGCENELSTLQISLFMGLTILGGLTLQWPIGALSDIFERRKIMNLITFLLLGISTVLCFAKGFQFITFISLMILFGGIMFTVYPLSISYAADRLPQASITTIICVMLILFGAGCIVGPLLAPLFMSFFPHMGFFLFMGSLALVQLLFGLSPIGKRNIPSEENFVPLPQTSLQSASLDPRQDEELPKLEAPAIETQVIEP